MTSWSQAWKQGVALERSKRPGGRGEGRFSSMHTSPACIGHQVQAPESEDRGSLSSAVTYQEADRKTTKSIYLTVMISVLDQLCSPAKELLRKMLLGWPREKNQPLAANLRALSAKISPSIVIFPKRFHIHHVRFSTQHIYEVGTIFTI